MLSTTLSVKLDQKISENLYLYLNVSILAVLQHVDAVYLFEVITLYFTSACNLRNPIVLRFHR